jgi:LysM repeat protein
MSQRYFYVTLCFLLNVHCICAQNYSRNDYIEKYKKIAVDEMKRSGIPASITLAQGMLESENGNSSLAYQSNNHFGIKCHKTWKGKKVYHDDDKDHECFRKYPSAVDSYRDHTDFLVNTNRYEKLFEYKSNDYKNWAKGLKKAGYATSRTYAQDLIRIIEENELYRLDKGDFTRPEVKREYSTLADEDFVVDIKRRKIYERNRIKYIIVEQGDDLNKITKDMELLTWQLTRYNEIQKDTKLETGQVLYIQPKRRNAEVGHDFHTVAAGETMYSISQLYGIKLSKLLRKNRMEAGQEPQTGQKIWLRKRKPYEPPVIKELVPDSTIINKQVQDSTVINKQK